MTIHHHRRARITMITLGAASLLLPACQLEGDSELEPEWDDDTEQRVVYGTDDRVDPPNHPDLLMRELSESVAIILKSPTLTTNPVTGAVTFPERTLGNAEGLCTGEAFANQAVADDGWCTGWLISPTRMVTAGHCFYKPVNDPYGDPALLQSLCDDLKPVFDFELNVGGQRDTITTEDVFSCTRVVDFYYDKAGVDYAVFDLDRDAGRPGLPINPSPSMSVGDDVVVVGHGSALLKKIDDGGEVQAVDSWGFRANTDTFHINSGSPVFDDATNEVVGILVRGWSDYEANGSCNVTATLADDHTNPESIVTLDQLGRFRDVGEPNDSMGNVFDRPLSLQPQQQGTATYETLGVTQGFGGRTFRRVDGYWDDDFVPIPVYGGDGIEVSINFDHGSGDLDLELLSDGGHQLDLSAGVGNLETVAATAGGAGASVYYARVYGYNGAVNDYSLRVEVTPSPMDLDGDGVVEDRTTCGGPTNVGCPDIPLPGGTYYAQECNPRPNRGQGLALGQQLDLAELAGVCEPNTWAHRVHLDLVTDHPYADNLDEHLVVGLPSTASDVTLYGGYVETEANYDFLYLTDGTKISGIHASPQYSDSPTSRQVAGRRNRESIDLRFTSDSGVTDDGFHFGYFDWSS